MANVQDFDEMMSEEQQNIQEMEESLRKMKIARNPGDYAMKRELKIVEDKLSLKKTNVLKLQSQKNRLLNPVSLCSDLYFDVLIKAIASQSSLWSVKKMNIFEFTRAGKEGFAAVCQLLKQAERLTLSDSVRFRFSNFLIRQDVCDVGLVSKKALENFIRIAAPNLSFVRFDYGSEKYSDAFFDALSKESNQTILQIYDLPKVNDITKLALQNLVQKRVLVRFTSIKENLLSFLPPCHFESLNMAANELNSLRNMKCTFRKLELSDIAYCVINLNEFSADFVIDGVEEILLKCSNDLSKFEPFCTVFSRIFPTTTKLTVDFNSGNYHRFEDLMDEVKEAMKKATQKEINLNLCIRSRVSQELIELFNGRKIGDKTYEWEPESDGKKIFTLIFDDADIDDLDYNYNYSSSSSDYDDYDS